VSIELAETGLMLQICATVDLQPIAALLLMPCRVRAGEFGERCRTSCLECHESGNQGWRWQRSAVPEQYPSCEMRVGRLELARDLGSDSALACSAPACSHQDPAT
jgi:hypothetical protein